MAVKITIVNLLTLIRIIGTILLIPLYHIYGGVVVGLVSLICYFTDLLDGVLARHWHVSTFFGAMFDGVADKLFTITNFIVMLLISKLSLIPIIIEILILLLIIFKFYRNLNIKSNIIGKIKMWVLALFVILTFFLSDIDNLTILSNDTINWLKEIPETKLYLVLLTPVIIMEVLTLISYIIEIIYPKENINIIKTKTKKIKKIRLKSNDKWQYIKEVWLNPEFYDLHKNDSKLSDLRKMSKACR